LDALHPSLPGNSGLPLYARLSRDTSLPGYASDTLYTCVSLYALYAGLTCDTR